MAWSWIRTMAKLCSLLWIFAEPPSEPSSLCQYTVMLPELHPQNINCRYAVEPAGEPAGEQQCNSLVVICTLCSLYVYVGRLTSLCKHLVHLLKRCHESCCMTESACVSLCAHMHHVADMRMTVQSCSSRVTTQPVSACVDQYCLVSCTELRVDQQCLVSCTELRLAVAWT